MVAYWRFDDGTAVESADGHDGAIYGAIPVAGALEFDGSGDYVSVPDSDLWTFAADFTIELWAKFDAFGIPHQKAFIGHDEGGGSRSKWFYTYDSGVGRTLFHTNTDSGVGTNLYSDYWTAQPGVWYHIALVREGSLWRFYLDGIPNGTAVSSIAIENAAAPLTIAWAEGGSTFAGSLDEVAICDRALTSDEVQQHYETSAAGHGYTTGDGIGDACDSDNWTVTWVPPLSDGTSIAAPAGPYKRGRTIPAKFRLLDGNGQVVPDAEAETLVAHLHVFYEEPCPQGEPTDPGDDVPDAGDQFRYDAADDLFIYNLGTKDPAWLANYTYGVEVLINGIKVGEVFFSLR
jgi:hypothetical protein